MSDTARRLHKRSDLTRWNRAGLSRFTYVDGDAASWLEELRLAMMGLVARGAPFEERLPETWRERFSQSPDQWPDPDERDAFVATLAWQSVYRDFPQTPESSRRRNERLLNQYLAEPGDYGWEIMRASARAAHVLLGHLDAYANEGYLRTATQWENLKKLAAMVNYQPSPPTSATTRVGLIVDSAPGAASVEIARGLAMKFAPPDGGSPVVFETLERITVHRDLNAARAKGWDFDTTELDSPDCWIDDKEADLAPGTLAVLEQQALPDPKEALCAVILEGVLRNEEEKIVRLELDDIKSGLTRGNAVLHVDAKAVRRGLPHSGEKLLVAKVPAAASYPVDSIVLVHTSATEPVPARVVRNLAGHLQLELEDEKALEDEVSLETLVPILPDAQSHQPKTLREAYGWSETGKWVEVTRKWKSVDGNVFQREPQDDEEKVLARAYSTRHAHARIYARSEDAKRERVRVVKQAGAVVPSHKTDEKKFLGHVVRFAGKPPKGLAVGDVMIMKPVEGNEQAKALRVAGISLESDEYTVEFDQKIVEDPSKKFKPDQYEFHGPMTRRLRPRDYDRNPESAFAGATIELEDIGPAARELVRLGKACLVEDERGKIAAVLAYIRETSRLEKQGLRIVLDGAEGLSEFKKGWTKVNLNTVLAGHGETRSPKTLGSGDSERARQSFVFKVKDVSFVPASVAETGVAPDMDVEVDGVMWEYRDLTDPRAEASASYSISQAEDGSLNVHFRRRLPTGTDNIVVRRYRTGVGPAGSVPARAFTKPMKKHRYVSALIQPLPASGGADREPVDSIRTNAPARLAANGRAVSLRDFERLCLRRSDIWQARAYAVPDPSRQENIALVVVPANGGALGETFRRELAGFLQDRTLPGLKLAIEDYHAVGLLIETKIRVDTDAFDRAEVQAAAQKALAEAFALKRRALGQPVYRSEIAAVLERVRGVETVQVKTFQLVLENTTILRTAYTAGHPSAFFPKRDQVVAIGRGGGAGSIAVEVEARS